MESFSVANTNERPENELEAGKSISPEEKSVAWSQQVDEIVKAEIEKKRPEMIQLTTKGLGDLFELLPKDREIAKEDIVSLLEHTELRIMLPGMRDEFAKEAIKRQIHNIADKAQFITESLETDAMKMFIQAEAQKDSIDDSLKSIREAREGTREEQTQ